MFLPCCAIAVALPGDPREVRLESGPRMRPEVEVKPDAFVSKTDLLVTLTREHRQLDERLRQLDKQVSMTAAERVEYCLLKKRKLLTKDRIARITASA
jgi:hypothetical protein